MNDLKLHYYDTIFTLFIIAVTGTRGSASEVYDVIESFIETLLATNFKEYVLIRTMNFRKVSQQHWATEQCE